MGGHAFHGAKLIIFKRLIVTKWEIMSKINDLVAFSTAKITLSNAIIVLVILILWSLSI